MNTIIVNLFGAPGAGKSTGAAYIFTLLKMQGVNAELVTEFAKDKVWEETKEVFNNQAYLFGKQSFRLSRVAEKVDVIVTDSPLPLSIIYNAEESQNFNKYVIETFNRYINRSYFLQRVKDYNPIGRFQTQDESDQLATKIKGMLNKYNIPYDIVDGNKEGYEKIADEILYILERCKENNVRTS